MKNQQNNKNDKNDKDNKKKNAKILAIFLIVSILGTFFFNSILTKWRNGTEKTISYNKFVTMLDKDQVKRISLVLWCHFQLAVCDLYTFYLIFIKHCDKFILRNRFLRSVSPFC